MKKFAIKTDQLNDDKSVELSSGTEYIHPKPDNITILSINIDTQLPEMMAFLRTQTYSEIKAISPHFKTLFQIACMRYFFHSRTIDKNRLLFIITNEKFTVHIISVFVCLSLAQGLDIVMYLLELELPKSKKNALFKRILALQAKEKESNISQQSSFFKFGVDNETLDTLDEFSDLIQERVPTVEQQNDFLSNIVGAASGVTNSVDKLTSSFSQLFEHPLTKAAADVKEKIEANLPQVVDVFSNIKHGMYVSIVMYLTYKAYNDPSNMNIVSLLGGFAFCVYSYGIDKLTDFLSDLGTNFIATVMTFIIKDESQPVVETQSGTFEMFSFFTSNYPGNFVSKLNSIVRLSKDLPEFIDKMSDLFKYFISYAAEVAFGIKIDDQHMCEVDKYNSLYEEITTQFYSKKFSLTVSNSTRLKCLMAAYVSMLKKLDAKRATNLSRLISDKLRVLREIDKHFKIFSSVDKSIRQEPVCIVVTGPPGVKKSVILDPLANICLAISLSEKVIRETPRTELVYPRNFLSKHWTSYSPTTEVVTGDDYNQKRDYLGCDASPAMDVISMVNTAPMPLEQAHLDDKGNSFGHMKWVILNTNAGDLKPVSIISGAALQRRFDFKISLTPKREYAKSDDPLTFDPDKIFIEEGVSDVSLDKYIFNVKSANFPKYDGKSVDDIGLRKMFKYAYDIKSRRHEVNVATREREMQKTFDLFKDDDVVDLNMETVQPQSAHWTYDVDLSTEEVEFLFTEDEPPEIETEDTSTLPYARNYQGPLGKRLELSDILDDTLTVELQNILHDDNPSGRIRYNLPFESHVTIQLPVALNDSVIERFVYASDYLQALDWLETEAVPSVSSHPFVRSRMISRPNMYDMREDIVCALRESGMEETELLFWCRLYTFFYYSVGRHPTQLPNFPRDFGYYHPLPFFIAVAKHDYFKARDLFLDIPVQMSIDFRDGIAKVFYPEPALKKIASRIHDGKVEAFRWLNKQNIFVRAAGAIFLLGAKWYVIYKSLSFMFSGLAVGIKMLRKFMYPAKKQNYQDPRAAKVHKKNTTLSSKDLRAKLEQQGNDNSGKHMYDSIAKSNISEMQAIVGKSSTSVGLVLWLDAEYILMPEHYIACLLDIKEEHSDPELAKDMLIRFTSNGVSEYEERYATAIQRMYMLADNETHVAILKISSKPKQLKKNVIEYFANDNDIKNLSNDDLQITLLMPSEEWTYQHSEAKITRLSENNFVIAKSVEYYLDSGAGDCGMPIFCREARLQKRRIIGIHVGGTSKRTLDRRAYSALVTREMILEGIESVDAKIKNIESDSIEVQSMFVKHYHSPYNITDFVLSRIGKTSHFTTTKAPAMTIPKRGIDPYAIAEAKYYLRETNIQYPIWQRAIEDYTSFINSFRYNLNEELIPLDIALWGDPGNPFRVAIPASTSAGYPLKYTDRQYKARLLGPSAIRDISNPNYDSLKFLVDYYLDRLNSGIRDDWYYTNNLKDTLVSIEKSLRGDGRMFSGAPFILVVLGKILFGEFFEFMMRDCLEKGTASSVNVYQDWEELVQKLSQFDTSPEKAYVMPIDYKSYDASQSPTTCEAAVQIINSWYQHHGKNEYALARQTFAKEVSNSKHFVFDNFIEWNYSLPSGAYVTLMFNNLVNHLIFRYCYYRAVGVSYNIPYHKKMYTCTVGDDNITSVSRDLRNTLTAKDFIEGAAELGFVMTSDVKNEQASFKPLAECSFLKRSFNMENGRYYANLSLETIMNTVCWSKRGPYYNKITRDSINFFFRELSLHPKPIFEEKAVQMRKAIEEARIPGIDGLYDSHFTWRNRVLNSDPFFMEW